MKSYIPMQTWQLLRHALNNESSSSAVAVQVMLETGARCHEAIQISKADLHGTDSMLTLYGAKGSLDRRILISQNLMSKLTDLFNQHSHVELPRLATYITRTDNLKSAKASLRRWFHKFQKKHVDSDRYYSLHELRFTWINLALDGCSDVTKVQHAIGHRSLSSTAEYLKDRNATEVFQLMNKLMNS